MRGVVSLAAAFGVPMTTLSGAPFPGRPQLVFLTFVVVIGTLLLHGLTLPWLIRRLGVQGDEARTDAIAAAAAQDKAARAAADRLDELLADAEEATDVHERAAEVLRGWNTRRRNSAWERLGRDEEEIGESPAAAFRRLRLEMLAAERETFIAERDAGQHRRRGAAVGAARARSRGSDTQPEVVFGDGRFPARHRAGRGCGYSVRGSGEAMMFWPSLLMTGDMWAAQADHFGTRAPSDPGRPPGPR